MMNSDDLKRILNVNTSFKLKWQISVSLLYMKPWLPNFIISNLIPFRKKLWYICVYILLTKPIFINHICNLSSSFWIFYCFLNFYPSRSESRCPQEAFGGKHAMHLWYSSLHMVACGTPHPQEAGLVSLTSPNHFLFLPEDKRENT